MAALELGRDDEPGLPAVARLVSDVEIEPPRAGLDRLVLVPALRACPQHKLIHGEVRIEMPTRVNDSPARPVEEGASF